MNRKQQAGFTLIEIMLVVVIIGVLMGIVAVKYGGQQEKARVNATLAEIRNYGTALGLYELDNGNYPTTEQGLRALETKPTSPPEPKNWRRYLDSPVKNDPWGNPYLYKNPGDKRADAYDLSSRGPDGQEGTEDDIANWK